MDNVTVRTFKDATYEELLGLWDACEQNWGYYSCDCYGFYVDALHKEISERGGWPPKQ